MSTWALARLIAAKDLRVERRSKIVTNQVLPFAGITMVSFAFALDKHNTIGQDCVAMCVDDIVCQGARPLFFLDYLGVGKLKPHVAAEAVAPRVQVPEIIGPPLLPRHVEFQGRWGLVPSQGLPRRPTD